MKKKRRLQSTKDRRRQLLKNRKKKSFCREKMYKFQNQLKFLILRILNYYLFAARHALIEMLIVQPRSALMTSL